MTGSSSIPVLQQPSQLHGEICHEFASGGSKNWAHSSFSVITQSKIYSAKRLPPNGIEPATLELGHILCLHSHALTTELTWQVLTEGYLTSFVLAQLTIQGSLKSQS